MPAGGVGVPGSVSKRAGKKKKTLAREPGYQVRRNPDSLRSRLVQLPSTYSSVVPLLGLNGDHLV